MAIHEKEYRKNRANITSPRLVLTDFSWAIILACLREFCSCGLTEYLNREHRIITGAAPEEDLGKTILHICLAHAMNMNRRELNKAFKNDQNCDSKVHFTMRFIACLVNAKYLRESIELMRNVYFVMNSKFANENASRALHLIEKKVNNLNLIWDRDIDVDTREECLDS